MLPVFCTTIGLYNNERTKGLIINNVSDVLLERLIINNVSDVLLERLIINNVSDVLFECVLFECT